MKTMLYIGHEFHLRTKSNVFFLNLLRAYFDITYVVCDPYTGKYKGIEEIKDKHFDYIFLWQIMPRMSELRELVDFENGVYTPMYDAVGEAWDINWYDYFDFKIICFSKTLHDRLEKMGMMVYYIQYFPKPVEAIEWGNEKSAFFWQRKENININTVDILLSNTDIGHVHLHKALDPKNQFIEPQNPKRFNITYSEWFENADDVYKYINESAFYISSREYEGIGMGFLEAMARGRCVIATNRPTLNEYIVHGETGFLYSLNDLKPLEIAGVRRIQENALEYVRQGYQNWEKTKWNVIDWILSKEISRPSLYNQYDVLLPQHKIQEEKLVKFRGYFFILSKWLENEIAGRRIEEYFRINKYTDIAIYGVGHLGKRLNESLKRCTEIKNIYFIDKNVRKYDGKKVYGPGQGLPDVQIIVVTTTQLFDEIKYLLKQKSDAQIVSIEELVATV